jgi:hypoxanthine-DNA glycosylase
MMLKRNFPPVVDANTRVLVLGSLPGEASLKAGRYYANPQNLFWRLTGAVLETDLAALPYEARLAVLLRRGVGLWDTVAEARRTGSLDSAIRDATEADLVGLVRSLPSLRAVAFNGAKAAGIGTRQLSGLPDAPALIALPSSSPANASRSFEKKAEAWSALRPYLDQAAA